MFLDVKENSYVEAPANEVQRTTSPQNTLGICEAPCPTPRPISITPRAPHFHRNYPDISCNKLVSVSR